MAGMKASLLFALVLFTAATVSVGQTTFNGYPYGKIDDLLISPSLTNNEVESDVSIILFASGFQIYTYNGTVWALTNVSADLYDCTGLLVGHHFFLAQKDSSGGQPTWMSYNPPSQVTGVARFSIAPSPPDSINWVLLQKTQSSGSAQFFGAVAWIQRLFTHGGLAPPNNNGAAAGATFNSYYNALYKYAKPGQ